MNESRNDVTVFEVEVVMGTEYVGRDNTGEGATMLFVVGSESEHDNFDIWS